MLIKMADTPHEIHGVRVLECAKDGARLHTDRDALPIIEKAWEHRARLIAIPIERLDDDFFQLKTGVAGAIIQKLVQYRFHIAIVGDISRYVDESTALRDFVREANRGDQIWFAASLDELGRRLERAE